jgi:hypothetical protein
MSETRILIRLLRMKFPRNWEFGSALSKLRNFGGVGPPKPPSVRHWHWCTFIQNFFNILKAVSLICLLGMKEFQILHSIHYNPIITFNSRNGGCEILLNLVISISVKVTWFWRQVLVMCSFWVRIHFNLIQLTWIWRQRFPTKRNGAEIVTETFSTLCVREKN